MKGARWAESTTVDPEHSNVRSGGGGGAESPIRCSPTFNDIASIPTLTKEEEVMLAKEMESATHEMRSGILLGVVHLA